MSSNQIPTLGQFNKMICDSLKIWTTEDKDVSFNVDATEKERRHALKEAFTKIQKDNGSYGGLDELISITRRLSPLQKNETKKKKTIQAYVNQIAKEDFSSIHELVEFQVYVETIIDEMYTTRELSIFAKEYYSLAINLYREFIREFILSPDNQTNSFNYFVHNVLINLLSTLLYKHIGKIEHLTSLCKENWPLRAFVDTTSSLCNVSLHKLHQFHELRINNKCTNSDIWKMDFKSTVINSQSKQVIDRLSKGSKMSWNKFYSTVSPLFIILPTKESCNNFPLTALSVFIAHNLKVEIKSIDSKPYSQSSYSYPFLNLKEIEPISVRIDTLFNQYPNLKDEEIEISVCKYKEYHDTLTNDGISLNSKLMVPTILEYIYGGGLVNFPVEKLHSNQDFDYQWINDWVCARQAYKKSDTNNALKYFKDSVRKAKYQSGPLFVQLFVDICAFCKIGRSELVKRNEEHLFDSLYEQLGDEITSYASLIGIIPENKRDSDTLMPQTIFKLKNTLISKKISLQIDEINKKNDCS